MSESVARFRDTIERRLGLTFDDSRLGLLEEVLRRHSDRSGKHISHWLDELDAPGEYATARLSELARDLTVQETSFFRHLEQLRAFVDVAVPELVGTQPSLRVLCAGCCSGDEPSSIAILLRESLPGTAAEIHALDVNPSALERARRGVYSEWSLRDTTSTRRARWFRPQGTDFVLDPSIRASIRYHENNLVHDGAIWAPGSWDAIFCRNVLMYFRADLAQRIVARFARALRPGGFLFLGHAETLRGLSDEFALRHERDAFFYQTRAGGDRVDRTSQGQPVPDGDWVQAIGAATERIERLAVAPPVQATLQTNASIRRALELLHDERVADAQAELLTALPAGDDDPDVRLLEAVLFTHGGDRPRAEQLCRDLLTRHPLTAGAHYLIALCREDALAIEQAIEHDERATYLDPGFAMPRLHLGLMCRRSGDRHRAVRELGRARVLLQREDPARIVMFGGGYSRDALIELCDASLSAMSKER